MHPDRQGVPGPGTWIRIERCAFDAPIKIFRLNFALWTRKAILALLQQEFGITMTLQGLSKYLKKWNFTPQKPICRAYQRDDVQVERWLKEKYPSIAAKAKKEKGEINWGDETGLRSDDVNGRSYAPAGKTPIPRVKGTPEKLNMISTVTSRGQMRFMFYKETMTAQLLIKFLKRLLQS